MVQCNVIDCKKNAYYGFVFEVPLKCGIHRIKPDMTNVIAKRCEGCKISLGRTFGYEGEEGTHCGKYKKDGMIDIKSKKCIDCKKKCASFGLNGKDTHCVKCSCIAVITTVFTAI